MLVAHHGALLATKASAGASFGQAVLANNPQLFFRMTALAGQQEPNLGSATGAQGIYVSGESNVFRRPSLSAEPDDYSVQLEGSGFFRVDGFTFFTGAAGQPITVEMLLAVPALNGLRAIMSFGGSAPYLRFNGANIEFLLSQVAMLGAWPHKLAAGDRAHIVLVRRPGNVFEVWLNGALLGAVTQSYSGAHQVAYMGIEAGVYNPAAMRIDEFAFYEKALSGAQIAGNFESLSGAS